ncbi:uncharacterized protein LY79DRAFT_563522 [Colletotrichum navitas]|uniref:Uncharacterized protein n=1 Tax=Colletotrichum navitas TaxID=681940 RepID=A0AAD8PSY4_9PEZI|nr:uncharacterized protein LY79DRAFT_563522 [Colletotrichum navitas]KAK1579657.1 hypothetical protein LY79DRAFT_563522 [Colletotrichum navitas]
MYPCGSENSRGTPRPSGCLGRLAAWLLSRTQAKTVRFIIEFSRCVPSLKFPTSLLPPPSSPLPFTSIVAIVGLQDREEDDRFVGRVDGTIEIPVSPPSPHPMYCVMSCFLSPVRRTGVHSLPPSPLLSCKYSLPSLACMHTAEQAPTVAHAHGDCVAANHRGHSRWVRGGGGGSTHHSRKARFLMSSHLSRLH